MKVYLDKNVYDATVDRLNYIFDEFELIYLSVSAGKGSSVMLQIANEVAKQRGRTFDIFFVDLEAQYSATISHMEDLKSLSQIRDFYHICLPINLSNSNSVFQSHWTCWKTGGGFVRDMPKDAITIDNHPFGEYYTEGEEFETFMVKFPKWLMKKHNKEKVAGLVGIRTDESFNRFRAIAFGKQLYKGKKWSTDNGKGYYSMYPIYDWRTEDIWHAVHKFDFMVNEVYEMLWKNGVGIHSQRICQPYGQDQRVSLNQWAALEPETWHKVVNRVSGANFGSLYCKSSLLGHNGTEKPDFMSWQEYTVFLLESLSLYAKELMEHYVRKIRIYFQYYKDNYNIEIKDIPDYTPAKEVKAGKYQGKGIHWKKIAKCIEKNDFICRSLSYGVTAADKADAKLLKTIWGDNLGLQQNTKELRKLGEEIS